MENDESLNRVEELIESGELEEAQKLLDTVEQKSGRKYFLQSRIFGAKGWLKERRRQIEFAINCEPDNTEYRAALAETVKLEEALRTEEDYFARAEELIKTGDLIAAQHALYAIKVKSGRKYFLQSKIYKSKC